MRTTMLSAAPLASITVRRTKPGPSGEKNTLRRSAPLASGTPLTSTAPDPHPDGGAAVEPDRPGVAIAVGGAGLERDAVADRVLGRRRADQNIADIPGRHRLHQPARLRGARDLALPLGERQRRAAARQT